MNSLVRRHNQDNRYPLSYLNPDPQFEMGVIVGLVFRAVRPIHKTLRSPPGLVGELSIADFQNEREISDPAVFIL
jgi:hypothetical protein